MSDREAIFKRLSASLIQVGEKAALPEYEAELLVARPRLNDAGLWENFARNFAAVNGKPMKSVTEVVSFLKSESVHYGYCDPALSDRFEPALKEIGVEVVSAYDKGKYEDYQFGITQAAGAIAETGTVVLTDTLTSDRLGALTPWIHIAVLPEAALVETLGEAIASFEANETNIIWATGPSKTADIEGILIEGVHGPGEQVCLLDNG